MPIEPSYIHFLDSDDYLELDCVEECVKVVRDNPEVEIVWHKIDRYMEVDSSLIKINSGFSIALKYDCSYSPTEIFKFRTVKTFAWVCQGIFSFYLVRDLRFIEEVECEDIAFGIMLIAQSQNIYLLDKTLYCYRIRDNSTCQYGMYQKDFTPKYPPYMQDLIDVFDTFQEAKRYSFYYSLCVSILVIDDFIHQKEIDPRLIGMISKILLHLSLYDVFLQESNFSFDPRQCQMLVNKIRERGYDYSSISIWLWRLICKVRLGQLYYYCVEKLYLKNRFVFNFAKKIKHIFYQIKR